MMDLFGRFDAHKVLERGLYLDLQPCACHVFDLEIDNESHCHRI
jgi:hypothetical protein